MQPERRRIPYVQDVPESDEKLLIRPRRRAITRTPAFRNLAAGMFRICQRLGVSIIPRHFYWPVPDLAALGKKDWTACTLSPGVDLELARQTQFLEQVLSQFRSEWNFPESRTEYEEQFHFNNGFFERVDAEIAYSMVRQFQPKKIMEVGSGHTTKLLAQALSRNEQDGQGGELISIEPYPSPVLKRGFPGLTRLITKRVQEVPLELFETLESGDILFLDSSHVVAMDSDVVHEFLRILPALKTGVIVHFHDIFMPADYPRKFVMTNLCFWSEQYLLEAFLSYNRAFSVLWSSSAMQFSHREILERHFPEWKSSYERMPASVRTFSPTLDGQNVWPCSFWMQKTAA
jgi:Methyltransferase domain